LSCAGPVALSPIFGSHIPRQSGVGRAHGYGYGYGNGFGYGSEL